MAVSRQSLFASMSMDSRPIVDPKLQAAAALKIQCLARRVQGKARVTRVARQAWQRVFDPKAKRYFFYNKITGTSKWTMPLFIELYDEIDHDAATEIERVVRGFNSRRRVKRIACEKYSKYYDAPTHKFYYMDNGTQRTFWDPTIWLIHQNIPLSREDQLLYDSICKIKELEEKLAKKDNEIKEVKLKRFEELEVEVIKDKVGNAKRLQRSKHMDDWTTEELAAWFTQMKMEEYIPFLFKNRVDGALFINLSDEEWHDMTITNRFHIRKLQLIMGAYRIRYAKRREKRAQGDHDEEDDELLSDYAPSELSDIINQEGYSESEDDPEHESFEESFQEDDEDDYEMTEEERIEMEHDKKNIVFEVLAKGDEENYPMVGDVVRVRYTCTLADGKMVTSTKAGMGRPHVEFVLGVGQVVKGFDRGIPMMSLGERARIKCTPEYGYGKEGCFPLVPPDAELVFDVTLLGFRPREVWIKPLIQEPGLSQKPYLDVDTHGIMGSELIDETSVR